MRKWMRVRHQPAPALRKRATAVAFMQLHEINGPLELRAPLRFFDNVLPVEIAVHLLKRERSFIQVHFTL
jgi:hypothetical protein